MSPIIQTTKTLRPREKHDFYPTPIELCRAALATLPDRLFGECVGGSFIIDPGAGEGPWGQAAKERWENLHLWGCDIRDLPAPEGYDVWNPATNWLNLPGLHSADAVIGNPPYKLAEEFVRNSFTCVHEYGHVLFLLRLAFLEGQARGRGLWKEYPPTDVHVLMSRPSFTGNGKTDATAYAIYHWDLAERTYAPRTSLHWLDWSPK